MATTLKEKLGLYSLDQGYVASTSEKGLDKMAQTGGYYFVSDVDRSSLRKLSAFTAGTDITGQTDILKETKVPKPKNNWANMFRKSPDVFSGGRLFKLLV